MVCVRMEQTQALEGLLADWADPDLLYTVFLDPQRQASCVV